MSSHGPSHHLLRTLAAVAPRTRILILGPDDAGHAGPLAALGFDVVQSAADGSCDWVVAADAGRTRDDVPGMLDAARRALVSGGWVWVAAGSTVIDSPELLTALAAEAGLALAEAPAADYVAGRPAVRGIYRRVGEATQG